MTSKCESLQAGDILRCPHCHHWHPLVKRHDEGTPYTQDMLYWECRLGFYYAGQVGGSARFPVRRAA